MKKNRRQDYSSRLKREIIQNVSQLPCCRESFLAACLKKGNKNSYLKVPAGNLKVFGRSIKAIVAPKYRVSGYGKIIKIRGLELFPLRKKFVERVKRLESESSSKHCIIAFLQGLFLRYGYLQNPARAFHLEIRIKGKWLFAAFKKVASLLKLSFKRHELRGYQVAYLKSHNKIKRFLNQIGLFNLAMEFADYAATKKILGRVNRQVNFETANINRIINASESIDGILRKLIEYDNQEVWSENLRQTAVIRLKFPQDSIEQLGQRFDPPLSKSAVNHRLRRIKAIFKKIFESEDGVEP